MIGFTAAHIQVIFQLSLEFGVFTEPLGFVEWFMLFNKPVDDPDMYQIS